MIEEWGPAGRRPRKVRRVPRPDETTGNAIFDGVDDDGPAMATLGALGVAFVALALRLVLL